MVEKTTNEIKELLNEANLDFEAVENQALNKYLPKLFTVCPFTNEYCTRKQCTDCEISNQKKDKQ